MSFSLITLVETLDTSGPMMTAALAAEHCIGSSGFYGVERCSVGCECLSGEETELLSDLQGYLPSPICCSLNRRHAFPVVG